MEVEQPYVIKFLADKGTPGVKIVSRLRNYYGVHARSRTQVYWWINEVKRGEWTSRREQAPEEIVMNNLLPLLPVSWMPTAISRRESWHTRWGLQHQQFVVI
jgi:hypothetical protein